MITDAKSLYDVLERSVFLTRNLTERRTAIEVTAIRQRLEHGFIHTGRVNSDRQMADGLTKPQAAWKLLEIMSAGNGKSFGKRLSRVQEQNGQKAKEILIGDEFSIILLLYHVAF